MWATYPIPLFVVFLSSIVSASFIGNHNIWLQDVDGNFLQNIAVWVQVNETIVGGNDGFDIQLNCLSPTNDETVYQQFCINVDSELTATIEPWAAGSSNPLKNFYSEKIVSLPEFSTIQAGWEVGMVLTNDESGVVTSVTLVAAVIESGEEIGIQTMDLSSDTALFSPITAISVEIVGIGGSETTTFTSGAGFISYFTPNSLVGSENAPQGSILSGGSMATGENSNMQYGDTVGYVGNGQYSQSFSV
jgi:hypothetical protein